MEVNAPHQRHSERDNDEDAEDGGDAAGHCGSILAATHVPRHYNARPMQAVVIREHGGPDRLEWTEVPDPQPRLGFAIVRVRAVALNHLDVWVRRGVPGHKFPLPLITGAE